MQIFTKIGFGQIRCIILQAPLSQVPLSQVPLSQAASSYNAESVIIPTVEQPSAYKTVLVESTVATVYPAVPVVSKEVLALEVMKGSAAPTICYYNGVAIVYRPSCLSS